MVSSVLISADMIHNGDITPQVLQLFLTDAWRRTESLLSTQYPTITALRHCFRSQVRRLFFEDPCISYIHLNLKIKRVHTHAVHDQIKKFVLTHPTLASPDIIDMAWL